MIWRPSACAARVPSSVAYFEDHRIHEADFLTVKHVSTPSFFARLVTAVES